MKDTDCSAKVVFVKMPPSVSPLTSINFSHRLASQALAGSELEANVNEGWKDGLLVGLFVGREVGEAVGEFVGATVARRVGEVVGPPVVEEVG